MSQESKIGGDESVTKSMSKDCRKVQFESHHTPNSNITKSRISGSSDSMIDTKSSSSDQSEKFTNKKCCKSKKSESKPGTSTQGKSRELPITAPAAHGRHEVAPETSNRRSKIAPEYCFLSRVPERMKCDLNFDWQRNKYVRDECGSGIVTNNTCSNKKLVWCHTPLTMYQATIGELGRKILCGEERLYKDLFPEPPSSLALDILPPCRGYFRKYDCVKPCEEELAIRKEGKKIYRSPIERYWNPCEMFKDDSGHIRNNAAHNAYLSKAMRRRDLSCNQQPCW